MSGTKVDVLKSPFTSGECRCQDVPRSREELTYGREKMYIVFTLPGIRRVFPINCYIMLAAFRRVLKENRLSIPSSPYSRTSSFADDANFSRFVASAATAAKLSLPLPPPPTDRMTFRWPCLVFSCWNDLKQPLTPSTSILESAHSSLSYPHTISDLVDTRRNLTQVIHRQFHMVSPKRMNKIRVISIPSSGNLEVHLCKSANSGSKHHLH